MKIAAADISKVVDSEYENGLYWPEPLIQINPNYKPGSNVLELAEQRVLHPVTTQIWRSLAARSSGKDLMTRVGRVAKR